MRVIELVNACAKNINECNRAGIKKPRIQLLLPMKLNHADRRYPFGRKGPSGEIMVWGMESKNGPVDVCLFDTIDLLAFLVARGSVTAELIDKVKVEESS